MNPVLKVPAPDDWQRRALSELSMMNLLCRPAGVVLACSDCGREWPVHEGQPFVAQLRLVALGHTCPERAEARAGRSHLHLVTDV